MVNKDDIIKEILSEVSYRSKEGFPNFSKPAHISILSEVLTDMGLTNVKYELIKNLLKEDEKEDEKYHHKGKGVYVKIGDKDKKDAQTFKKDDGGKYTPIDTDAQSTEEKPKSAISGKADFAHAPDIQKKINKTQKQKVSKGNGYTGSKKKALTDTNPIESKNYQMDLQPTDDVFEEKNKNNANPTPPESFKLDGLIKNPKFPKRYVKVLERMINSRITSETAKWKHFSDIEGGAGKISAQAG